MRFNYKFKNKNGMRPYQYDHGKIYKIVSPHTDDIYIGSTINKYLSRRLGQHTYDYVRYLEGTFHYLSSFDILKFGDYSIVLLENFMCDNKKQLDDREGYYIQNNKCVNKYVAGRDKKNRLLQDGDTVREQSRKHYHKHKVGILSKRKQYRQESIICADCGIEYKKYRQFLHVKQKQHLNSLN